MNGHGVNGTSTFPQPPLITMTAVPGYGPAPLTVGFFVNTVDPEGKGFVSYVWNFGDGQVSMDPPLTFFHTYTTAGTLRRDRQCDHLGRPHRDRVCRSHGAPGYRQLGRISRPELMISTLPLSRL